MKRERQTGANSTNTGTDIAANRANQPNVTRQPALNGSQIKPNKGLQPFLFGESLMSRYTKNSTPSPASYC
jgi:hypothetical protein